MLLIRPKATREQTWLRKIPRNFYNQLLVLWLIRERLSPSVDDDLSVNFSWKAGKFSLVFLFFQINTSNATNSCESIGQVLRTLEAPQPWNFNEKPLSLASTPSSKNKTSLSRFSRLNKWIFVIDNCHYVCFHFPSSESFVSAPFACGRK